MEIDPKIVAETAWLFWEVIVKDIIKKGTDITWKQFKHHDAKQKYQKRITEIYSTMRVLYKLETVSLSDYYVDLFILEEPEAYRKYGVDYLESNFNEAIGFYNRGNRSDAFLIATEYNFLFVLGKPGAGKTTLLRYLATMAAKEKIEKVPIFISFNIWAYSEKSLFEFIVEQFDICGFPNAEVFIEKLLEKGDALILLDGLDEISDEGNIRGKMIYEIENLIKKYKNNKVIITCRNAANEYKFADFTYVEIADLSPTQISVLVKKWFGDLNKANNFLTELTKEENQSLKELSHNPLLLGMLCFVFEETSSFPPKRGLVYKEAIDALTKRWDKERGVQRDKTLGFSPSFEKKLLSYLAYEYFLENKVFFEQDDIERKFEKKQELFSGIDVEYEDILNTIEIQHGLLARRARYVYTFSHLTFQEYFTAQYILDRLDTNQSLMDDLFTRLHNQRWREVFPLVASLITNPKSFFDKFITQIRKPINKDKVLQKTIKNIHKFAETLQGSGDIITARMRAIALTVSISRMIHIVQKTANKRSSLMAHKVLSLLNTDETVIDIPTARETARVISMGLINTGKNRDKFNKTIKLAAKYANQTDFDMGHSYNAPIVNLDNIRSQLREHLKVTDEKITKTIKDQIQHTLEKSLLIDNALRISLDFKPKIIELFVASVNEIEFPKTFATEEEWFIFKKNILQSTFPEFGERILELKDDHLPVLEQFIRGNIFLLDCLNQSQSTDYFDHVFTITPL